MLKNIFYFLLIAVIMNILGYFFFEQMDVAWENRAKAAGYYDSLPDNMKNPKDLRK